ncbi:hypothetical protein ACHAXT_001735 [Thalassiosira profunda]
MITAFDDLSSDERSNAMQALGSIAAEQEASLNAMVNAGGIGVLVGLLGKGRDDAFAVRALSNIATVEGHEQAIIDAGFMSKAKDLLRNADDDVRRLACKTVYNVVLWLEDSIELLFSTNGVVSELIRIAKSDEWEVRVEAIAMINAAIESGTVRHVMWFADNGAIDALCNVLDSDDETIVGAVVDSLNTIVEMGRGYARVMSDDCLNQIMD